MTAVKKERIDLRLNTETRSMIEEAAAMNNQSITQFMVESAAERAELVMERHRRLILSEESWNLVMEAISHPTAPNERLKRASERLASMEQQGDSKL
ncbi:DUF1778 domain-containing protein [Tatumella sp. UBA2305]|uniref:type II toxin-antitoxin system TacA family antitoxin n=1 Tax=Tatumella sp. UBA2305 TaxID=1947647 RepID=UPI0025E05D93|nr:DUF1778 domain-containing protein [Tatumella sp. UBA2305]